MSEKKYYVEALDEVIAEYCEHPSPNSLYSVLYGIFEGIEQNYSLPCLAKMDDDGNFSIMFAVDDQGKESVAALTRLDGEEQPIIADVKMRTFNKDGSEGLMAGNNIRCVAKYMYDHGYIRSEQMVLDFMKETPVMKVERT